MQLKIKKNKNTMLKNCVLEFYEIPYRKKIFAEPSLKTIDLGHHKF